MSDLQAGTVITGTDSPETLSGGPEATSQTGITSTSYAAGSPTCGVAFVAPTTGRVLVHWSALMDNNTVAAATIVSFEMRAGASIGSGSVVVPADDQYSLYHEATNDLQGGMWYPVSGLTPGSRYNVRTMHRVTAGSGTVNNREIIVQPLT